MRSPKVAVVQFPGSNCEYETLRAVQAVGMTGEIIRWNAATSWFDSFDGYILPGGFSYQDRVRSGAIAAKLDVVESLVRAADAGKPVLGICNGCQILAEVGLVPGFGDEIDVKIALTDNLKHGERVGFICDWVYVKVREPEKSVFTSRFSEGDVLPIPINHGEGRFVFSKDTSSRLRAHTRFQYCDADGKIVTEFPVNPNGSADNLAAVANQKGNVLAMMPHPERATFIKQLPFWMMDALTEQKRCHFDRNSGSDAGPWQRLMLSMKDYLDANCHQWQGADVQRSAVS